MDANRFDDLSRKVVGGLTRRQGLLAFAGAVAAAVGLANETEAAPVGGELCLRVGKRCTNRKHRCCGKAGCKKGRCQCRKRFKRCKGSCIAKHRCCGGCKGDQVCRNGRCVTPVCGNGGSCTIFTTSTRHSGDLGGLSGADAICQQRATEANLPGTYLAWLADDTTAPVDRMYRSPEPYVRTDGMPIAANWAGLTSGLLAVPIDRTETAAFIEADREAWTNVSIDGSATNTDPSLVCDNWTSGSGGQSGRIGETSNVNENWTNDHSDPCNSNWRLYCVQQG